MSNCAAYDRVARAVAAHGLDARGGFHPTPDDLVPDVAPGHPAQTVLLIGNTGAALWHSLSARRPPGPDPIDTWTRAAVTPIAAGNGARAVFPADLPPLPFQRWAERCEDVAPSPLGLLIHPEYGLWHAYRAALLFPVRLEVPARLSRPSPCSTCRDRPCLTGCPVGAYGASGFDVAACRQHIASAAGRDCLDHGCKARDACPVGRSHRYPPEQVRHHMAAFASGPSRRA